MCIRAVYTTYPSPNFFIENAKITLVLAETKNEGKVVVRFLLSVKKKIENVTLTSIIPFETKEPTLRQCTLLDEEKNREINLNIYI
jgi:hypothetical protein